MFSNNTLLARDRVSSTATNAGSNAREVVAATLAIQKIFARLAQSAIQDAMHDLVATWLVTDCSHVIEWGSRC